MATLLKLQITGIRSFGPYDNNTQQLKFVTPVTLILGQNGCGKTTIIESIRYACTGDLPANSSSGQAFVNDPKMSQNTSTKGQVKLKFRDSLGYDVTMSRIAEVIQSPTGLRFCSKSMSIRYAKPNGEQVDLSGRCTDITTACCQRLNISPSVLSNVVFCHQENSTWPLDETKKVKDKFDEIFDSSRYNICTEKMKKLLKEKESNIKLLKNELAYKDERKQAVEKDKRKLQSKQEQHVAFVEQIADKEKEKEPVQKRIEEICHLENELGTLQTALAAKEEAKKGMTDQQTSIRKNITEEFIGSNEDLQNEIASSEGNRTKDERHILDLDKKKSELEDKSTKLSDLIQNIQTKIGELNQEKVQYERKLEHRQRLLETAKDKIDVYIQEDPLSTINNLTAALTKADSEFKNKIEQIESEEKVLQEKVNESRDKQVRTKQSITSIENELKQSRLKIREISNELGSLNTDDYVLKDITNKLEQLDKDIMNLKKNFNETEEDQKMYEFKKDIQTKERLLDNLDCEHKVLQQNDVTEGKIESERQSIRMKEQEMGKILFQHDDELDELFGGDVPKVNIGTALTNLLNQENVQVKTLTESISKLEKDVTRLEAERKNQSEKIASLKQDLNAKKNKIEKACRGKSFNETIDAVYQRKEKLQKDKGHFSSFVVIYEKFLKDFEKDSPCCPVCETSFANRNDAIRKIMNKIRTKVQKIPKELATAEENLRKEEETYNKLEQLRLVNEEIQTLSNEKMPLLKKQLAEIDAALKQKTQELNQLKEELEAPQKKVDISRQISSDVASIDHHRADIERSEKTISYLQEQIVKVDSNKTKQQIEEELETVKSDIAELRRKTDLQQKKLNKHKDKTQQLTQERSQLLSKQLSLQESMQKKPILETQKTEFEEKIKKLNDEFKNFSKDLSAFETELKSVIETKEKFTTTNKATIEEERKSLKDKELLLQDIKRVQREIDTFADNAIQEQLDSKKVQLEDYKAKEEVLNQTRNNIMEAIADRQKRIANHELLLRNLRDNLMLREKEALADKLNIEIVELKKKIGNFNYRTVFEEKQNLLKKHAVLEKNINNLIGEKNGLMTAIKELEAELNEPKNKQAYTEYLSKFYEVTIAKKVIEDLYLYIKGFEQAIIEFHKAKMVQINQSIRELWRDIYRGNDIDFIEIKTEYGGGKRSSYEYKVVQNKKGVELDMRGRCSAGQKVLACLIIRMALAETLSTHCGILALDEPTTNLDRENIHSLCECLSRIITQRSQDKNFQLIIITHDEEFLTALSRVQALQYFYRITRNPEGFSEIKKEYALGN